MLAAANSYKKESNTQCTDKEEVKQKYRQMTDEVYKKSQQCKSCKVIEVQNVAYELNSYKTAEV